jgi:hypothetical protein
LGVRNFFWRKNAIEKPCNKTKAEQDKGKKTQEKIGRLREDAVALLVTHVWKTRDKNGES